MITFNGVDGRSVWAKGKLVGPPLLRAWVDMAVAEKRQVGFNYWAPVTASIDDEWSAYLTIGAGYVAVFRNVPDVSPVPNNPAGYTPEGVITDEG